MADMVAVGIKLLKNRLSEYVRRAAAGETVLVLDRERVVAEMGPPRPERTASAPEEHLAEAIRKGYITPPQTPAVPPTRRFATEKFEDVMADLERSRADRDLR